MALHTFATLNPEQQEALFQFITCWDPSRFADVAAMRNEYSEPVYGHGRQHFSLWDGNSVRGTIALVTLEVATKGEAYLVSAYARNGDPEAFSTLVTHAMAACPTPRPLPFKLGLAPTAPHLDAYASTMGFEEYDAALVLTLDRQAGPFPTDGSLCWAPLNGSKRDDYQAIYNQTLAASPNGDTLTNDDMDQMLASRDRPEWSGLFTLDGTPVGLAQLAVRQGIGWIEAIAIAPAYQGRGLGRLLVGSCVDQLRARQAQTVRLLVFQSNEPALRLYRRVGFGRDEVKSRWWRLLAAC